MNWLSTVPSGTEEHFCFVDCYPYYVPDGTCFNHIFYTPFFTFLPAKTKIQHRLCNCFVPIFRLCAVEWHFLRWPNQARYRPFRGCGRGQHGKTFQKFAAGVQRVFRRLYLNTKNNSIYHLRGKF